MLVGMVNVCLIALVLFRTPAQAMGRAYLCLAFKQQWCCCMPDKVWVEYYLQEVGDVWGTGLNFL